MRVDGRIDPARVAGPGAAVGDTLVWDGMRWVPEAPASGSAVIVSATEPAHTTGQLWADTGSVCDDPTFVDTFNRANNTTLGPDWTVTGTWHIDANTAYLDTLPASGNPVAHHDVASTDMEVSVTFQNLAAHGPVARLTDGDNCYWAQCSSQLRVWKRVAGVQTQLGSSVAGSWTGGDVCTLAVDGTSIEVFKNGVSVFTITDSSITTGTKGGVMMNRTNFGSTYSTNQVEIVPLPLVTGVPLKLWDGTQWLFVACMTPV